MIFRTAGGLGASVRSADLLETSVSRASSNPQRCCFFSLTGVRPIENHESPVLAGLPADTAVPCFSARQTGLQVSEDHEGDDQAVEADTFCKSYEDK